MEREIEKWLKTMEVAGALTPEQARLRRTAVRRVMHALRASEPRTPEWVASHLDELIQRLGEGEERQLRPGTARTYRSRVETALREFIDYSRDPQAFLAELMRTKPRDPESQGVTRNMIDLGDGRCFEYVAPRGGLSRRDIERISFALWAQASDFDGRATQLPLFRPPAQGGQ